MASFPKPTLPLFSLLLVFLVACGSGAGEEGEDAEATGGADRPVAGAAPDTPGEDPSAPRAGVNDTVVAPGSAVPPTPGSARPPGVTTGGEPLAGPDSLTGVVATFGAEPLVQFVLETADGRTVPLGDAEGTTRPEAIPDHPLAELARLSGATVRVIGQADAFAAAPGRGFAVDSYEVLRIEGSRPFTGTLVRGNADAGTPDRLEADRGAPVSRVLVGMPAGSPATGSIVWVIAAPRGDTLLVSGYGVLRPARP